MSTASFDFVVIGGGSGGISCAKRAASYGANVALVEGGRWGGTCVNVGCVPKKIMWNAAYINEVLHDAKHYGFQIGENPFNWGVLKESRDKYITRLNKIYENGLDSSKVTRFQGFASFVNNNTIKVGDQLITSPNILIATGGKPKKLGIPGEELTMDSNGFFDLVTQPKKVAVIGAGYIAVELAGVFQGLGTAAFLFVRGATALRHFDHMLSETLDQSMKKQGIEVVSNARPARIERAADGTLTITLDDGRSFGGFEHVLQAIGREALTEPLNLPAAGVAVDPASGDIQVDAYQNTSTPGVYALGDVCGQIQLTPMAIAAGRRLSDRLFGKMPLARADYTFVPTVVFSHPVIGTIGYTEAEAKKEFGEANIKIYNSSFVNLWYGPFYGGGVGDKPMTRYKLVCQGPTEKVIGLHCIGMASDEVLQGFGVAIKMGATKADFDNCVAIHPTAAEEFVTIAPWGLAPGNPASKTSE